MTALRHIAWMLGLALVAACGGPEPESRVEGRVITPELWLGPAVRVTGPAPAVHPVDGRSIQAWTRISHGEGGDRRQVLAVTQEGAALGRVADQRPGVAELRFTGDVVFPLGLWRVGERRDFTASEVTLLGSAERRIKLEILDLDFVHQGASNALRYRLEVRDAAGRVLACETSVYAPGKGLVAFQASTLWSGGAAC